MSEEKIFRVYKLESASGVDFLLSTPGDKGCICGTLGLTARIITETQADNIRIICSPPENEMDIDLPFIGLPASGAPRLTPRLKLPLSEEEKRELLNKLTLAMSPKTS